MSLGLKFLGYVAAVGVYAAPSTSSKLLFKRVLTQIVGGAICHRANSNLQHSCTKRLSDSRDVFTRRE